MVKNVEQLIKRMQMQINPHYDMHVKHVNQIFDMSRHPIEVVWNAFNFGYAQGVKAEKVAQRRAGV